MATPLRVLMISDVYFPRINGVSTSISTFRSSLPLHGVESLLIAPAYGTEENEDDIRRIPGRTLPRDPEDRLMYYRKLRSAVCEAAKDCDVIHIQTPFAAQYAGEYAARTLNKPAVATYHTLFEEYLQHYIPVLPAALLRTLARQFSRSQCNALDAVVVPSSAMEARLRAYGVSRPIHVLPTGLPESAFKPGDRHNFRARHGIPDQTRVVLFVGRVAHEKNIDFLLKAVAEARKEIPDLLFLITGEGPALPELRRQVARLGLDTAVRFMGYMDRNTELRDAYAAADAFIFASRTETQGLVLLEAMAQGCPVVALSAMGTADILDPGRGGVVAMDDTDAFGQALAQLLANPSLRAQLGEAARTYALEWSDGRMAQRLADLYRSLAGRA